MTFKSWYNKLAGAVATNGMTASEGNITSAYVNGNLGALTNNGGFTETISVNNGVAIGAGTFAYGNSIDGYYFKDASAAYRNLDYFIHTAGDEGNRIDIDQREKTRGGNTPDPYIPTMGAYEVNTTTMVDDLPNGMEWSSAEFSDLIKVHKATQSDLDTALMELVG